MSFIQRFFRTYVATDVTKGVSWNVQSLLRSAADVSKKPFVVYPDGKDYWDLRKDP